MEATAKLRDDLVISRHDQADGVRYVVKDPASGRFFRFGEVEGHVLELLDGRRTPEDLRKRLEEKFEVELTAEELDGFVARLKRTGLVTDATAAPPPVRRPKRVSGDIFFLRIKLLDPDRALNHLNALIGSLVFTRAFALGSAATMLVGIAVAATSWSAIVVDFRAMFANVSFVGAWAIVAFVVAVHEFSHGLACKRYGGNVREMGFLLIFGLPAFYCNVSDAWLFPEKWKRLLVTLAGAWSELFLWSLAVLTWRVTEPHTLINSAALVIVATSGIKALFNLNPLIKLDGYYLLSDWLEIPNLRARALGYVKQRIKGFFTLRFRPPADVPRRERWIFAAFGALAGPYSLWLLWYFAQFMWFYLVETFKAPGLVVFCVFIVKMARIPVGKLVRAPFAFAKEAVRVPKKAIAVIGGAALGAAALMIPVELKVSGEFTFLPARRADVRSEVEGIISRVHVAEGDTVPEGALIATLSDRELESSQQRKEAEIAAGLARLKLVEKGPRAEEIQLARATFEKAEEQLRYATGDLDRTRKLLQRSLVSEREFEQAEELVAVRQKELEESRNRLNALRAGSRPEEIAAALADQQRLSSELQLIKAQRGALAVHSPIPGIVTTQRLHEKVGQKVGKGDLIAEVQDVRSLMAEIQVSEKEMDEVAVGQKVALKSRAYPSQEFVGAVAAIAPAAVKPETYGVGHVVVVRAEIPNDRGLLKPGTTGIAKISVGRRTVLDVLLRKVRYFTRVEVWSWF